MSAVEKKTNKKKMKKCVARTLKNRAAKGIRRFSNYRCLYST
jgi:hypothetical protein